MCSWLVSWVSLRDRAGAGGCRAWPSGRAAARRTLPATTSDATGPGRAEVERFLLVGTFGAVGAALAVGTAAALLRYHRTGEFPGTDGEAISRGRRRSLWARVVVGGAIATWALADLSSAGLL
jgi:hypothetical protein